MLISSKKLETQKEQILFLSSYCRISVLCILILFAGTSRYGLNAGPVPVTMEELQGEIPAAALEKRVTITGSGITIKQAFDEIEKQTGYTVAYNRSKFNPAAKVTLYLHNAPLDSGLNQVIKGMRTPYKIKGRHIIPTVHPPR